MLWIGLNPSTADASFDDPTIGREIGFSMSWDCDAMVKCNIADYRATKPEALIAPNVEPCSRINLPMIRDIAKHADLGISLADASIVVLAQRHGLVDVLTLDQRHFRVLENQGTPFRVLPADA